MGLRIPGSLRRTRAAWASRTPSQSGRKSWAIQSSSSAAPAQSDNTVRFSSPHAPTAPNKRAAIQFSKLAGFSNIITIASHKHSQALKSMGATHVIDRQQRFPAISAEISEITGGLPITFVFDAISGPDTQQVAYDLLPPSDGQLAGVTRQAGSIEAKTPGKRVNVVHVHVMAELSENSEELLLLYRKLNILLNEGAIKARFFCYSRRGKNAG